MRLLNVNTRMLEEFLEPFPNYAILSHTWGPEEVLFDDLKNGGYESQTGFQKLDGCCKQATNDGFRYVWIDTCCIDKSSSAELSEAINSMCKWYRESAVCYTYLVDVPPGEDQYSVHSAFRKSRWFTRGWTLQELIVPTSRVFFDRDWGIIDFRKRRLPTWAKAPPVIDSSRVMEESSKIVLLSEITNIPKGCLMFGQKCLRSFSVADKLSWAASRETTRKEDEAYCLMGLFDVNMPLLYGEGDRAFIRLQEKIVKSTAEQTIFTWGFGSRWEQDKLPDLNGGVLAPTPRSFLRSTQKEFSNVYSIHRRRRKHAHILPWRSKQELLTHSTVTNQGIHIELPIKVIDADNNVFLAALEAGCDSHRLALPIVRIDNSNLFARAPGSKPIALSGHRLHGDWKKKAIYLKRDSTWLTFPEISRVFWHWSTRFAGLSENGQIEDWSFDGVYPPCYVELTRPWTFQQTTWPSNSRQRLRTVLAIFSNPRYRLLLQMELQGRNSVFQDFSNEETIDSVRMAVQRFEYLAPTPPASPLELLLNKRSTRVDLKKLQQNQEWVTLPRSKASQIRVKDGVIAAHWAVPEGHNDDLHAFTFTYIS